MKDMKIEANRWWRQTRSDFAFLPKIKEMGKYDTCCFLAQQTAEKALKAFLFFQGEELIFTHSIFKLCEMASKYEEQFLSLRENVKQLDFYYVEARYPNAIEDVIPADFYYEKDAASAIQMTEAVISLVSKFLETAGLEDQ